MKRAVASGEARFALLPPLLSTDWPFENIDHAADWFDRTPIAPADRQRVGRINAVKLFKLDKHLAHS